MDSQRSCVLPDVIWTYFRHFWRCSCAKFINKIVDVWALVAQQLFACLRHVLCRTTLLYKVVWPNCCPCGRTFRYQICRATRMQMYNHNKQWYSFVTKHLISVKNHIFQFLALNLTQQHLPMLCIEIMVRFLLRDLRLTFCTDTVLATVFVLFSWRFVFSLTFFFEVVRIFVK